MLWFVAALILLSVIVSTIAFLFLPGVFVMNPDRRVSYEKAKKLAAEEKANEAVTKKEFAQEADTFVKTS